MSKRIPLGAHHPHQCTPSSGVTVCLNAYISLLCVLRPRPAASTISLTHTHTHTHTHTDTHTHTHTLCALTYAQQLIQDAQDVQDGLQVPCVLPISRRDIHS